MLKCGIMSGVIISISGTVTPKLNISHWRIVWSAANAPDSTPFA